ncbi:LamG domain-containing protein [Candidatus Pacearchaeota archaeon]|nr:LamG domain-containing protein [Candidatus Pacearchaeota archaeon]
MKKFSSKLSLIFSKPLAIILLIVLLSIGIAYAFDVFVGGSENVAVGKGLIGHWTLDGEDYNSATNRVTDRTPYSNHGINYGATLATDRLGKSEGAMGFDGVDDYIDLSGKALDNPNTYNGKATVSLWIKPNEHNNGFARYIAGFHYWMVNSNGKLQNMVNKPSYGVNYWLYGTKTIPIGEWTHVVYQLENNVAVRYYVDGVLDAQHENSSLEIVSYSTLSAVGAIYNDFFNGSIEDVRIYNRILSEDEIKLLYESYNPAMETASTEGGLIGHWKMDEAGFVEYTENLVPYTDYSDRTYNQEYEASCWGGDLGTMYYYSSGGYNNLPYKKMIKTAGGTGGCYHDNHLGITIKNNTVYTVSAWMKANQSVTVNGYALDLNRPSDNAYRVGSNIQLTTEWQRYFWVYSAGSDHAGNYWARNIIYVDDNLPIEIYWSGFQVEERSYTTPYVNGIRQSKLTDNTPYSNSGTINGTNLTTDRFGKEKSAVIFDGVDDYITLGGILSDSPSARTICYWYNPYTDSTMRWVYKGQTYETYTTSNNLYYRGRNSTTFYTASISTAGTPVTWRHFCGIWNSNGNLSGYLNGNYVNSIFINNIVIGDGTTFYLGGTTQYNINGSIDDVRIYNRALSEDEIKLLYESYQPQTTVGSANAGLILDMPLTSKWTKTETPGSEIMTDRTPYSNDGQNYGADVGNDSTEFNGQGDMVQISNSLGIGDNNFTFSHWIKTTQTSDQVYTIGNAGGSSGYRFGIGSGIIIFLIGNSSSYIESSCGSTTVNDGNWHMITGVFDRGNNFYCYVDGISAGNVVIPFYTSMGDSAPGLGAPPCCIDFNGSMSGLRIYNRALSADEVKLLFDRGRA